MYGFIEAHPRFENSWVWPGSMATEALTARGQEFNIATVVDVEGLGSSDEAPIEQAT